MLRLSLTMFLMLLPLSLSAAPVPKQKDPNRAELIVGRWTMPNLPKKMDKEKEELVREMEFRSDGQFELYQKYEITGGLIVVHKLVGHYELYADKLDYPGDMERNSRPPRFTIKKLTETRLVIVDQRGCEETFERIRRPKK